MSQRFTSIGEFLGLLTGVRRSGKEWLALCPAHDDSTPSLSVAERDGKILLNCRSQNCTVDAVCQAMQVNVSDLFLGQAKSNGNGLARKLVCTYNYIDEQGKLLYQNVRYAPKDFRLRRPDGSGWTWNLGGVRRVPYNLPQILAADSVLMVEGEKDADRATALGFTATSSKNWKPEFAEFMRGKSAVIIADADDAGRKIADEAARMLTGKVVSLKAFSLPGSAKDLSEWVDAGGTRDALEGFIELIPEWTPRVELAGMFHTFADFENAPGLSFAVKDFLQNDAATLFGALSGHGKTLLMLSLTKGLLAGEGTKMWGRFEVQERAERVIYLIPESSIGPFKYRLKLFGLYDYVRDGRLLVRTLSLGPTPCLSDPRILAAAKGAHVALDTAVRFSSEGDENSAGDNQRGLATDIFALLNAGARTVFGAHHSPKTFATQTVMTLENVLRGTGDIGAMLATAWGMKQIDPTQNVIHIENVKPRDFEPPGPFQLVARPFIDTEGDFRMLKEPGVCGRLADEMQPPDDFSRGGGAPTQAREAKAANIQLLREWLKEDPNQKSELLAERFQKAGIDIRDVTVRKYRTEIARLDVQRDRQ